jgi:hypothetical protein
VLVVGGDEFPSPHKYRNFVFLFTFLRLYLLLNLLPSMKKIHLFGICLCIFSFFQQGKTSVAWHDSLIISSLTVHTDTVSKFINGVIVTFDYLLSYDSKHKAVIPKRLSLDLGVFTESGAPLKAKENTGPFSLKGNTRAEKEEWPSESKEKIRITLFVPYYVMSLPEGRANLKITLSGAVKDSSTLDPWREISSKGTISLGFTIHKPPVHEMKLGCSGVRVSKTDHGKQWDFGLSGLPDPEFKVILDNGIQPDIVYTSAEVQNSCSAAWLDPSLPFLFSEGDKITLGIYDKDTLIDDFIGSQTHTVDEWVEIAKAGRELAFDQVEYCTVRASKMK